MRLTFAKRAFSYSTHEVEKLERQFAKKMNMMKMYTKDREFNYEQPRMSYNKATGDVTILAKDKGPKKKIIRSLDDYEKEKLALMKEVGLEKLSTAGDGSAWNQEMPKDEMDSSVQKMTEVAKRLQTEFDINPETIYAFSRDFMRVDVGLIIARPPIFMHMRERDVKFMKLRSEVMNEHYINMKQHIEETKEVTRLNEDILSDNPYASTMNLDNFPTHTGEHGDYCAASKNFMKVDPECSDVRSLHYAGEDRTYLLMKNKYTDAWEFPTGRIHIGQTFMRAKQDLFLAYSENKWKVKFYSSMPTTTTIRDFSEAELENDIKNKGMRGVRTYYFNAHHMRGLPEFNFNNSEHEDYAWVPKRQLNEFFEEDYYNIHINSLKTR